LLQNSEIIRFLRIFTLFLVTLTSVVAAQAADNLNCEPPYQKITSDLPNNVAVAVSLVAHKTQTQLEQ
jgi:hypothetical protein